MIDYKRIEELREQLRRLKLPEDKTSREYDVIYRKRIACHDAIIRELREGSRNTSDGGEKKND